MPGEVLNPRNTWADKDAHDQKAHELAALFVKIFEQFKTQAAPEVLAAGPKV